MRTTANVNINTDSVENSMKRRIAALTNQLTTSQLNSLLYHAESLTSYQVGSTHSDALSNREREVLLLLSEGYSRKEIGTTLCISVNTAAKHISNIYQKIGVTTIAEATRYAIIHKSTLTAPTLD